MNQKSLEIWKQRIADKKSSGLTSLIGNRISKYETI
jgi:hypothetical protein